MRRMGGSRLQMKTVNPNYLHKGAPISWGTHFGRIERQRRGITPASGSMAEMEQIVANLLRELEAKPPK
jgi:hypothetical protein